MTSRLDHERTLIGGLDALGVGFERLGEGQLLVTLPGRARPTTRVWIVVGAQAVSVEALFLRRPEVAREEVLAFLLGRNLRSYGVHFAADGIGDLYLVGALPFAAVSASELDRYLGQVLVHVEEAFAPAAETAFPDDVSKALADGAGRRPTGAVLRTADPDPRR